jgi:hypothetical protein
MRGKKVIVVILCALLLFEALAFASVSLGQQKALADEATFYSTASDGFLLADDPIYNNANTAPNADEVYDGYTYIMIGQRYFFQAGPGHVIHRSAVFFDTSSLPDSAVVTSATLSLFGFSDDSDTDFEITVVDGSPLIPPLALSDYGLLRGQAISGGAFNTSSFSTIGYNDIPLNALGIGWISKTGMTNFGLRSSRDIEANDGFPNDNEFVAVYSSDYEEPGGFWPKLVVNYYVPSASVPTLSQWGMIGMGILLAAALVWSVRRRLVVNADKS